MAELFVPFGELQPGTHALTDASSLSALDRRTLAAQLSPAIAQDILSNLDSYSLAPALNLLERWIVCDHLVADLVALDSLSGSPSAVRSFRHPQSGLGRTSPGPREEALAAYIKDQLLRPAADSQSEKEGDIAVVKSIAHELSISFTLIPSEVFDRCMTILGRTSRAIQTAQPEVPWSSFGFGVEKSYGEHLADYYGQASVLRHSHLGVERTLVYCEAAAAAGIPLVLHPGRYKEALAINRACCDAYDSVKEVLQKTFGEPIRRQLESLGLSYDIVVPPLVSRLVEIAGNEKISILDAARRVKESANAVAFRQWLANIQLSLAQGTTGGKVEALRMLKEIERVASLWAQELDVRSGVTYKRRELRLSWIPRIGGLLELMGKITVRDPILNRKGYLMFISWWFDHEV